MKFRKKPVVIDAVQYVGDENSWNAIVQMGCPTDQHDTDEESFRIPTLEGDMRVSLNDWVIKGVKGEFYPCKPDIFEATYEKAE